MLGYAAAVRPSRLARRVSGPRGTATSKGALHRHRLTWISGAMTLLSTARAEAGGLASATQRQNEVYKWGRVVV